MESDNAFFIISITAIIAAIVLLFITAIIVITFPYEIKEEEYIITITDKHKEYELRTIKPYVEETIYYLKFTDGETEMEMKCNRVDYKNINVGDTVKAKRISSYDKEGNIIGIQYKL